MISLVVGLFTRLQILSSIGDGVVTSLLKIVWCFCMICILVFANHGFSFVFVKRITTVMFLRHLLYPHLTNFEFISVAWAKVSPITS